MIAHDFETGRHKETPSLIPQSWSVWHLNLSHNLWWNCLHRLEAQKDTQCLRPNKYMIVPQIKSFCSFTKWEVLIKKKDFHQIVAQGVWCFMASKNRLRSKTSSSYFQSEILQVLKEKTVATPVDLEGFLSAALFGVLTWEWPLRRRMICSRQKIYCKSYTSQSWTSLKHKRGSEAMASFKIKNWQYAANKHPQFFPITNYSRLKISKHLTCLLFWLVTSTPSFFPAGNNQTSSTSSEGPNVHHGGVLQVQGPGLMEKNPVN